MAETVEYLDKLGIIKVDSRGETSLADWEKSLEQVSRLNQETSANRVLLDARKMQRKPNTLEWFNFAANLPFALRFAVVVSESGRQDLEFVETVGKNRGKTVQLFHRYEQAIAWLSTNT